MRTQFSPAQLEQPALADAEANLRACMHCGICTATCPTYVLLGDERDGPRGRIVMMQAMLEEGGAPSAETVLHIDRCLSCLACRSACPSGVDYARLVDEARSHIEAHYKRPLRERLLRGAIAATMSRPARVRVALFLARSFSLVAKLLPGRLGEMAKKGVRLSQRERRGRIESGHRKVGLSAPRVALMAGCVQAAVAPEIDDAVLRLLDKAGRPAATIDGCCGALAHHLGRSAEAKMRARAAIENFERLPETVEAVTISATGCAAHLKDYAHLFRGDPMWEARAEAFARRVVDLSALVTETAATAPRSLRVAFHSACSAQNGLRLKGEVEQALANVGFQVLAIPEGHLCCGSAGSYSLLQPAIADALRTRKLENIRFTKPDLVATGNIGCMLQLSGDDAPPVVHYAELLDWAAGGPVPRGLRPVLEAKRGAL